MYNFNKTRPFDSINNVLRPFVWWMTGSRGFFDKSQRRRNLNSGDQADADASIAHYEISSVLNGTAPRFINGYILGLEPIGWWRCQSTNLLDWNGDEGKLWGKVVRTADW